MRRLFFLISFLMTAQILLGQGSNLIINGNNVRTCEGDTTVLRAVTGAIYTNYRWENTLLPGNTISTADSLVLTNVSQFGEFYALLVDSNGVTVDDTIFAIEFESPNVNLGPDTIICSGDTITLRDSAITGPLYSYQWNTGATTPSIQVSSAGVYRLRINAPFPNPCFNSDTVVVTINPALELQDQGEFNVCQGESLNVSAILDSGGISPYVFQWSPPALFSNPNAQNTTLNTNTSTTVSIKVTDRNGLGCSDSISFPVNIRPNVSASLAFSDTTICSGDSVDLFVNGTSGTPGSGGYNYSWSGPNILNATSAIPTVFPAQAATYLAVVSDSFNCDDSVFVNVGLDSFGISIANGDSAFICSGEAVQITMNVRGGDGNETFLWFPDDGDVSNVNIAEPTISGQGTFNVLATSSNGCESLDMVIVGVADLPVFTFDPLASDYCPSDTLVISGQGSSGSGGGYSYLYSDGLVQLNPDSSQNFSTQAAALGSGSTITLFGSVIDGNACKSLQDTISFNVINVPQTDLLGDSVTFATLTNNYTLSGAETADSIFWDFGNGQSQTGGVTQAVTYELEGSYLISAEAFFGICLEINELNVTVNPELTENIIYIPSAFSPNATNLENQTLKVYGENIVEEDFNFQVYTAWGDLIYESSDLISVREMGWVPSSLPGTVLVVNCSGKFVDGEEFAVQQTVNYIE